MTSVMSVQCNINFVYGNVCLKHGIRNPKIRKDFSSPFCIILFYFCLAQIEDNIFNGMFLQMVKFFSAVTVSHFFLVRPIPEKNLSWQTQYYSNNRGVKRMPFQVRWRLNLLNTPGVDVTML